MKHKRKCIEKKSYSTLQKVTKAIAKNYLHGRKALYYYECDICLDFHLTKNKEARSIGMNPIRKAVVELYFPSRKSTAKIIQGRINAMNEHLRACQKRLKKKARKGEILPIEQQRMALANLNQPFSWQKFLHL